MSVTSRSGYPFVMRANLRVRRFPAEAQRRLTDSRLAIFSSRRFSPDGLTIAFSEVSQ